MKNQLLTLCLLSLGVTGACTKQPPPPPDAAQHNAIAASDCLISSNSVGPIKLGMSVKEARQASGTWTFKRTSDGEGVALIEVARGQGTIMTVFAGEEDSTRAIDENAKIEMIDVSDAQCKTPEGVHPNMLVSDAEKIYGKVTEILMTEIESREYATFANQPKAYSFRLNEGANYPSGANITTSFDPKTTIMQISIRN